MIGKASLLFDVYSITYLEGTWQLLELFDGYFQNPEGLSLFRQCQSCILLLKFNNPVPPLALHLCVDEIFLLNQ
jgi:hypothetical protein